MCCSVAETGRESASVDRKWRELSLLVCLGSWMSAIARYTATASSSSGEEKAIYMIKGGREGGRKGEREGEWE